MPRNAIRPVGKADCERIHSEKGDSPLPMSETFSGLHKQEVHLLPLRAEIAALDPPVLFCEEAQPVSPPDAIMPASTPDRMTNCFVLMSLNFVKWLDSRGSPYRRILAFG